MHVRQKLVIAELGGIINVFYDVSAVIHGNQHLPQDQVITKRYQCFS